MPSSPSKGAYQPAWMGKPKKQPNFAALGQVLVAKGVISPPASPPKPQKPSPSKQKRTSSPVKSSNKADDQLRSSVNNKAPTSPTEDEYAQRIKTVRQACMQYEHEKLVMYKNAQTERRKSPLRKRAAGRAEVEDKKSLVDVIHARAAQKAAEERAGLVVLAALKRYHRKFQAAATIQKRLRGILGRRAFALKREDERQNRAAAVLQAIGRGHFERVRGRFALHRRNKRLRMCATLRTQALFRGKRERRYGESKKRADVRDAIRLRQQNAAVTLQKAYRGHNGRNQLNATVLLLNGLANHSQSAVKIFLGMDVDGSGSIDRSEFQAGCRQMGLLEESRMGYTLTNHAIDRVYDMLDDDGSGELSFKEMMEALNIAKRRTARRAAFARTRWQGAKDKVVNQLPPEVFDNIRQGNLTSLSSVASAAARRSTSSEVVLAPSEDVSQAPPNTNPSEPAAQTTAASPSESAGVEHDVIADEQQQACTDPAAASPENTPAVAVN